MGQENLLGPQWSPLTMGASPLLGVVQVFKGNFDFLHFCLKCGLIHIRCNSTALISHVHVVVYVFLKCFLMFSFAQIAALSNQFLKDLPSKFLVEFCF